MNASPTRVTLVLGVSHGAHLCIPGGNRLSHGTLFSKAGENAVGPPVGEPRSLLGAEAAVVLGTAASASAAETFPRGARRPKHQEHGSLLMSNTVAAAR